MSVLAHYSPGVVAAGFSGLEKVEANQMDVDKLIQVITSAPPAAEASDCTPVASEGNDPTLICSFCSFLCHLGRGPVVRQLCNLCKLDMEGIANA